MTYEGTVWHDFMNNLGIANVVLKYQLPKGNPQTTISDVEAAFAYIREHSEEWGIDPEKIGIMGFSAGGHIASTIATHSAAASPSFQILFYPVITMDASGTHAVTMQNFLGTSPAEDLVTLYSNEKQVTSATPECFLTYTQNDQLVPYLTNGKAYYDALVKAGVNVTLKAYESTSWPANGHGWAGYGNFPYKSDVESALSSWLKSL
jgi:acetyl esterase/lipase